MPNVLTVAGSDSGAGAGIQADLKTFAALEVYGCSAVTAITAQNTESVRRTAAVPAAMVEAQMEAVFGDIRIAAVKIGLLPTARVVRAVARVLARHDGPGRGVRPGRRGEHRPAPPGRVRPGGGARRPAASGDGGDPERRRAGGLTGSPPARTDAEVDRAARRLLDAGPEWVLVTGGHRPGRFCRDRLHGPRGSGGARWYRALRVETRHGHGTGCTLSSAIAARLALGDRVPDAVKVAKDYLGEALAAAGELDVGHGPGPLNHFFAMWRKT